MKYLLIVILSLSFSLTVFAQADSGFTYKAEAKNLKVNGLKDGKWIEYLADDKKIVKDSNNHSFRFFRLAVYKGGMLNGAARVYEKSGKLHSQTTYINNQKNGSEKYYQNGHVAVSVSYAYGQKTGLEDFYDFASGKLNLEIDYINGKKNGTEKVYYKSGKLLTEVTYVNNKENGVQKVYYEDGKLKQESIFTNDKVISVENYDEKGNELK